MDGYGDDDYGAIGAWDIIGAGGGFRDIVGADEDAALLEEFAVMGEPAPSGPDLQQQASRMRQLRQIDPNAVQVRETQPRRRRREPVGFDTPTIAPGAMEVVTAAPQRLFRSERLVVPSDIAFDLIIRDWKVGNESQLVSGGSLPAAMFTEVAIDTDVHLKTAEVGNVIQLSLENIGTDPIMFRAGLLGTTIR